MSTSQMQSPSRERRQLLAVGQFLLLFVDLCVFQQHLSRPSDYQCVSLFVFMDLWPAFTKENTAGLQRIS